MQHNATTRTTPSTNRRIARKCKVFVCCQSHDVVFQQCRVDQVMSMNYAITCYNMLSILASTSMPIVSTKFRKSVARCTTISGIRSSKALIWERSPLIL